MDFTRLLPGPYATMVLADLGAEVLKIEHPKTREITEFLEPRHEDKSAIFHHLNRNKRRKRLDFRQDEGRAIILKLVSKYDVIVEGFKPGVMKTFGLDYESLSKINSKIIFVSISGYGQSSSLSEKGGHDCNFLALSGISSLIGSRRTGPVLPGIQIGDLTGGSLYSVIAILSAIIHRLKTGEGQQIDVSMRDCLMTLAPLQFCQQLVGNKTLPYNEYFHSQINDYDYYETLDGRHLSIGAIEPKFIKRLCSLLEISNEKGTTERGTDTKLKETIRERISSKDLAYWMKLFENEDICVEPILSVKEAIEHSLSVENQVIVPVKISENTFEKQVAHPIKYSNFVPKYEYVPDNE